MYRLIEAETKTLMLANGRSEYAFTIVDPAVAPEMRIRPRRTLIALLGLSFGLLLGTAVAFLHSYMSSERERRLATSPG
jgi:LPS O-antigen subunit length determinant protein (WzzB/FepE family)